MLITFLILESGFLKNKAGGKNCRCVPRGLVINFVVRADVYQINDVVFHFEYQSDFVIDGPPMAGKHFGVR